MGEIERGDRVNPTQRKNEFLGREKRQLRRKATAPIAFRDD